MSSATFLTPEAARTAVLADLDVVDAALARIRATSTDLAGNAFRIDVIDRIETQRRVQTALSYRLFAEVADPPDADPNAPVVKRGRVGKALRDMLARRLRLTPKEIKRRFRVAAKLGMRRSITGQPLPPRLPVLAQAVAHGALDDTHIAAVCTALKNLPRAAAEHADEAEAILVGHAMSQDADFVESVGKQIAEKLNPDEYFDDHDRQVRRGLTLGKQRSDGMSYLSGWVTPELRSNLEAIGAAHGPGRHVAEQEPKLEPEDPEPEDPECEDPERVGAEPDAAGGTQGSADTRSRSQRLHDALTWGLRAAIESGTLGTHRGIPVTVIVTATLQQIEQAIRAATDPTTPMPEPARTGGGSMLPWRDLIRMAAGSVHYLSVYDQHTGRPLYLGRSQRLATLDQRIVCHARDKGCTRPDCTVPGYECEVMHVPGWYPDGATDADKLYFGCHDDHVLADTGHASLSVTAEGRLAWQVDDDPARTNRMHHPSELLRPPEPLRPPKPFQTPETGSS